MKQDKKWVIYTTKRGLRLLVKKTSKRPLKPILMLVSMAMLGCHKFGWQHRNLGTLKEQRNFILTRVSRASKRAVITLVSLLKKVENWKAQDYYSGAVSDTLDLVKASKESTLNSDKHTNLYDQVDRLLSQRLTLSIDSTLWLFLN